MFGEVMTVDAGSVGHIVVSHLPAVELLLARFVN